MISKSKQIQIDKTRLIDTFVNGWDRVVTNPILSLIKNNQDVAEVKKEARNDKNKCLSWLMKQINNQPDEINIGRLQEQLEMIFTLTTCSNNPPEFLREEIDARGEQPIEEILQYWITRFTYCT